MKALLYLLSQIALFLIVAASLRLTLFPHSEPRDWAVTIAYGSLLITPLFLARHDRSRLICLAAASVAWAVGNFFNGTLMLATVTYLCLWVLCLFLEQYPMAWASFAVGIYGAIMLQLFGETGLAEGYQIAWNLLHSILAVLPAMVFIMDSGHEAEADNKVSAHYKEAA